MAANSKRYTTLNIYGDTFLNENNYLLFILDNENPISGLYHGNGELTKYNYNEEEETREIESITPIDFYGVIDRQNHIFLLPKTEESGFEKIEGFYTGNNKLSGSIYYATESYLFDYAEAESLITNIPENIEDTLYFTNSNNETYFVKFNLFKH